MLTAENIQTQQFHVRFRGFDVDEVDSFLEKVAENYTLLAEENKRMTAELEEIKSKQAESQSQEETFKNAIISAQTIADEMKKKAEEEGEAAIAAAREQATALVDEANSKVARLEEDIARLQGEKDRIIEELRSFLTAQINNLDSGAPLDDTSLSPTEPAPKPEAVEEKAESAPPPGPAEGAEEGPADETEEEEEIPEFEAPEDDLHNLYEKIELPDDLAETLNSNEGADLIDQAAGSLPPLDEKDPLAHFSTELLEGDDKDAPPTIPDLDDDMLFTLEDPLDSDEPAVVVEPPPEEEKKK